MTSNGLSEEEYNAKLICLADVCPVRRKNVDCPLIEARKMQFSEKVQWLKTLSVQEKQEIYQYHVECFSKT